MLLRFVILLATALPLPLQAASHCGTLLNPADAGLLDLLRGRDTFLPILGFSDGTPEDPAGGAGDGEGEPLFKARLTGPFETKEAPFSQKHRGKITSYDELDEYVVRLQIEDTFGAVLGGKLQFLNTNVLADTGLYSYYEFMNRIPTGFDPKDKGSLELRGYSQYGSGAGQSFLIHLDIDLSVTQIDISDGVRLYHPGTIWLETAESEGQPQRPMLSGARIACFGSDRLFKTIRRVAPSYVLPPKQARVDGWFVGTAPDGW